MKRICVSIFVSALVVACVTQEEGQLMRHDLDELKADRAKLQAEQESALKRIDAKIAEVSSALDDLNRSARRTGADLGLEVDKAKQAVAELRGLFEETQHKIEANAQSSAATTALVQSMSTAAEAREKRLAAIENALQADQQKRERPPDKDAFYQLALAKLNGGDFAGARAMFEEFAKKWPDASLVPNARYWIGESHYGEKDYANAILGFQSVVKDYPKADKVPDALLKIGMSFAALKQCRNAEPFFEQVLHVYGARSVAKTAKEKLAECKRGHVGG